MQRPAGVVVLAAVVLGACAPRTPVARAIRARGGPLPGVARVVEAQVQTGVPGTWRWQTVFHVPDLYAWTIYTAAEPNELLYDGTTMRTWVGDRLVAAEPAATAALRSHARFTAVANLDVLLLPGVAVRELGPAELPAGAAAGLEAAFADDGSRYRLGFDGRMLLVGLEGPVALPPAGTGPLVARFSEFRRVRRWLLAGATSWVFRGVPLAVERALVMCPDPGPLGPGDFRSPATVPTCPPS